AALTKQFRQAGDAVRTVESQIPDTTPVSKQPLLDGFDDLIQKFDRIGADDAVRALEKQKAIIDKLRGRFTLEDIKSATTIGGLYWDQLISNKRRVGNDDTSAFKRIANDTATDKDWSLSQAYGKFIQASNDISPELAAANKQFSLFLDAMRAAG